MNDKCAPILIVTVVVVHSVRSFSNYRLFETAKREIPNARGINRQNIVRVTTEKKYTHRVRLL